MLMVFNFNGTSHDKTMAGL